MTPRAAPRHRAPLTLADATALSVIPDYKLDRMIDAAVQSLLIPGDMAELGVYRGGSALILGRVAALQDRTLHLFDTFAGMPTVGPFDQHLPGDFRASLQEVRAALRGLPVKFHVGVFPHLKLPPGPFCFVHLDCDLKQSYADGLAYFWPRLSSGGRLVLDDYEVPSCPGATLAVREFFEPLGIYPNAEMQKP